MKGHTYTYTMILLAMYLGVWTKLGDLLDAMVEWIQSLLIHKIEIIPSNLDPSKPNPKAANMHAKMRSYFTLQKRAVVLLQ